MRHGISKAIRAYGIIGLTVVAVAVTLAGCGGDAEDAGANGGEKLSGRIEADGSSTVGPLTAIAAEGFQAENSDVRITVGISGTGGGFERFCNGETDLSNASRPIKDEEAELCAENGVEFVEFRVATDAVSIVVNPDNDWTACLTVDQLNAIWGPDAENTVKRWSDVDPSFPDEELVLAGPGTDSGTFDYFTDVINGEEGASRADYTATEDDNVVVQAVGGEKGGMGYFGFSFLDQNESLVKGVEIDGGDGCVGPSVDTAQNGTYHPLSRPLFAYAKVDSFRRPEVQEFMRYYLENQNELAELALYIPLTAEELAQAKSDLEAAIEEVT